MRVYDRKRPVRIMLLPIRLGLTLLGVLFVAQINPEGHQKGLAESFLFQRLEPISAQTGPYSSPSLQYETDSNSNASNQFLHEPNQDAYSQYRHQRRSSNNHQPAHRLEPQTQVFRFGSSQTDASEGSEHQEAKTGGIEGCPAECSCNRAAQIADCSNRNLNRVPSGFPKDIKRIRLERNNITELGPLAFQGLRRLQRIDLSNNNLVKIDQQAFSGGLQSLNSLILYSNKLSQLPGNLFTELGQLQLLLLNANSLQCISRELLQPLSNLNLLSLYDNRIETLANGTFDGLKNIRTIHLGKNPLQCDCQLRWLADYLEAQPIETSEARCEGPTRNQARKLSQLNKLRFTCEGTEGARLSQCQRDTQPESCPAGCQCDGSTVDCSRVSQTESRLPGDTYELPDVPDDIPVYVTRMRINDNRIKRIRQTSLFRRLANSQKLDLGNNKIIDIEDNTINNGASGSAKPERVVFVLLENEHCSQQQTQVGPEGACSQAPRVNAPSFDSPCYNGGSCVNGPANQTGRQLPATDSQLSRPNYSCLCPPGFAGPLCEVNIDDCAEHQCQNGAMCVDGVNSYRCICRDPTTSGEFCEQLSSFSTSSANSIAPIALPMIASGGAGSNSFEDREASRASSQQQQQPQQKQQQQQQQQQQTFQPQPPPATSAQPILARSSDLSRAPVELGANCRRITQRKHYYDGSGCHSVRVLKLSECVGSCMGPSQTGCCLAAKVKRRRVRMQCNDGASYVKTIDLVKKCACSAECPPDYANGQQQISGQYYNASQEDQLLQIARLDAID